MSNGKILVVVAKRSPGRRGKGAAGQSDIREADGQVKELGRSRIGRLFGPDVSRKVSMGGRGAKKIRAQTEFECLYLRSTGEAR